jgi:hypothetical protein
MNTVPAAKMEPAAVRSNFCFAEICIFGLLGQEFTTLKGFPTASEV